MKYSFVVSLSIAILLSGRLSIADDDTSTKDKPAAEETQKSKPAARKRTVKPVVPVFTLNGVLTEKPTADDNPFNFGAPGGESLHSLLKRLKKAGDASNVPAIVLQLGTASVGPAQLEELSRTLNDLKEAGKKIHVHSDTLTTGQLTLISSASDLSMVPTGYMFITGMYGEQIFLRGLLDKIGVTPDFMTCGSHKSAGEMFMRTEPSDESAEMTKWLYDSLYDNMLGTIARGRGVDTAKASEWIDTGVLTSEQALDQGIINHIEHRQEFEARLRETYGESLRFDRRYGKKTAGQIDLSSPFGIMNFYAELLAPSKPRRSTKPGVGIVYLEGAIMDGDGGGSPLLADSAAFSNVIRKALDQAAEDDAIKAVVFRVNSPGGSAVASEVILNATRRVIARKPLIVSMGNVAASGGYYVSCGSDTIVADDSTITGSIGVVAGKLATTKMWDRLGINFEPVQRGKNASLLSSASVFSDDERAAMRSYMDATYEVFKQHITDIRGDRLQKPIEELAGGRVYTGRQALELGLVDEIGGLDEAIAIAAERAQLGEGYDVRVVPRPKGFMERLMSDVSGSGNSDPHLSLGLQSSTISPLIRSVLPLLQNLEPERVEAIRHALLQLVVLQNEGVSLSMPVMTLPR